MATDGDILVINGAVSRHLVNLLTVRNIDRWSELISSGDVRGIRRVMTGLDTGSIQMREVSPFGGLLSADQRQGVLAEVQR